MPLSKNRLTRLIAAALVAGALLAPASANASRVPVVSNVHKMLTFEAQRAKAAKDCALPVLVLVTCFGAGLPMITGDGPIMSAPVVYIVRWGWTHDPVGEAPYQEAFFNGVGGSHWAASTTQYCDSATLEYICNAGANFVGNPANVLKGTWDDNVNAIPADPSDAEVAAEARRAAVHFGNTTPESNLQAQYIVDLPQGIDSAFNQGFCAYHSSNSAGNEGRIAYTYFPYVSDGGGGCGQDSVNSGAAGALDGVSIVGGHEYAETVTDVEPNSGWSDPIGLENGDKCAFIFFGPGALQNVSLPTGTFAVQSLWSNNANAGLGGCAV